jgi:hypothetical protein
MKERTTAATKSDAAYVKRVTSRVAEELARRVDTLHRNGHKAADLGDPDELADRMLAAVPAPSPWRDLGPFYSTSGLARVLGGVSRQAIEERRRRRTILALRTADDVWVYPAFQLDERNRVLRGLTQVLDRFQPETPDDEWMVAAFVAAPQPGLDDRSVVEHLRQGGDLASVLALADERSRRWAIGA